MTALLIALLVSFPMGAADVEEPPESGAASSPEAPVARKVPVQTTHHGDVIVDEYRWMEDLSAPEVLEHLARENAYAEAMTAHTRDLRETLYREVIARNASMDLSVPEPLDGYEYYTKAVPDQPHVVHCRRALADGAPEEVLLDENELAGESEYFLLPRVQLSPSGRYLAYSIDRTGAERFTIYVRDLTTGRDLDETIENAAWMFAWANDNRTIFYNAHDESGRISRVFRRTLGRDSDARAEAGDELVYEALDPRTGAVVLRSRSGQYVIIWTGSWTDHIMYYLDADTPDGAFTLFRARETNVDYQFDHAGEHFYFLTNRNSVERRLLRVPVADRSIENWETVREPAEGEVITEFLTFKDHLAVFERDAGRPVLRIIETATGRDRLIEFPEASCTVSPTENPDFNASVVRFTYSSLVTPESVYECDLTNGKLKLLKQTAVPGYDPARYVSRLEYAIAPDGERIPISLVHRRDVELDGSNPTLMRGYGYYGLIQNPYFDAAKLSLLDRGFVYAIAHVRGGGELGQRWRLAGKFLQKENTFNDFIACAEHLIARGYTRPGKLAAHGRSAGGILIGVVINRRPDLFAAAIAEVPYVQMFTDLLDPSGPDTAISRLEYGNPDDVEMFHLMKSSCPYENVRRGPYPSLLVTAGLNDPRVACWGPAKWVARLRERRTNDKPLIFRVNMNAGHLGRIGRFLEARDAAFRYAFLIDQLGIGEQ